LSTLKYLLLLALAAFALISCGAEPPSEGASGSARAETTSAMRPTGETMPPAPTTVEPESEPSVEPTSSTPEEPAVGANGMVSTADPLATRVGLDVLADGGNAFDAAVAVSATLGVVEPYMSGPGGYAAIVVYDAKSGALRSLDSAGRTPRTLDPDVFYPPAPGYLENRRGIMSVTTPGMLNVWEELHGGYGELGWRRLLDPAVQLAEEGFPVTERTAYYIGEEFYAFPDHAREVYGNNGAPLREGERLVQEDLGQSLRLVSEEGAGALHGGELGLAVDDYVSRNGGFLTIEDMRANRAAWRETTSIDYRGSEVVTTGFPVVPWAGLERLGVLSRFEDPTSPGHNSADYLHRYAEVAKRVDEDRLRYYSGDPERNPPPLDTLLSEGYWADIAANVNLAVATAFEPPSSVFAAGATPTEPPEDGGYGYTTHFVVADREGNVVSASLTLGDLFGSRTMAEGTGIWLNDSLAWYRFDPRGSMPELRPGVLRGGGMFPASVMRDGKARGAIGAYGGYTIQHTVPQMLMNLLDFRMDVQRAIAAPRVSFSEPRWLAVEGTVPEAVRAELATRGHYISVDNPDLGHERGLGGAHGLTIEYDGSGNPNRFTGGADPRGEGVAEGL
jgi:gamma-glutamyltranspeptidase/glutathione hydrolase